MEQSFTFFDLNIERRKHLDRIMPYLEDKRPDVICFQEVFEDTYEQIKQQFGYSGVFGPRVTYKTEPGQEGKAIMSRFPIVQSTLKSYDQFNEPIAKYKDFLAARPEAALLTATLDFYGHLVNVATTHFTWSDGGLVTEEQSVNFKHLLPLLQNFPDLILTGDFNTPRGKIIFDTLAQEMKDNIPAHITTTIDPNLHRAGKLEYVVDGLFTKGSYTATHVQIETGLSDHCGILATITVQA